MDDIYQWDRDDKLFAIEIFKHNNSNKKGDYLLQLIIDDDPVVRGKAALALKTCDDTTLIKAADGLLDQDEEEKKILACEILDATSDVNFRNKIEPLLTSSDERVVRSAIETIDNLPATEITELLQLIIKRYHDDYAKPLKRVLHRTKNSGIINEIQTLYEKVDNDFRKHLLGIAAGLDKPEAQNWALSQVNKSAFSENTETLIRWLTEH